MVYNLFKWLKPKSKDISKPVLALIQKLKDVNKWSLAIHETSPASTCYALRNIINFDLIVKLSAGFNFRPVVHDMKWLTSDEREVLTYEVWKLVRYHLELQNKEQRNKFIEKLNKC